MSELKTGELLLELTADIVSAYVSRNSVRSNELPALIESIHKAMSCLGERVPKPVVIEPQKPAVPPKKSISNDYLICLEDGKKFKSLKRHLQARYNLSPDQYREKWGLDADYPMVCPDYAQTRSTMAKQMGFGRQNSRKARSSKGARK